MKNIHVFVMHHILMKIYTSLSYMRGRKTAIIAEEGRGRGRVGERKGGGEEEGSRMHYYRPKHLVNGYPYCPVV